jgi:hypothetical protein
VSALLPRPGEWDLVLLDQIKGNKQEWLHRQKFEAYKAYGEWFTYVPVIRDFLIGRIDRDPPPVPHWTRALVHRIEIERQRHKRRREKADLA